MEVLTVMMSVSFTIPGQAFRRSRPFVPFVPPLRLSQRRMPRTPPVCGSRGISLCLDGNISSSIFFFPQTNRSGASGRPLVVISPLLYLLAELRRHIYLFLSPFFWSLSFFLFRSFEFAPKASKYCTANITFFSSFYIDGVFCSGFISSESEYCLPLLSLPQWVD